MHLNKYAASRQLPHKILRKKNFLKMTRNITTAKSKILKIKKMTYCIQLYALCMPVVPPLKPCCDSHTAAGNDTASLLIRR